MNKTLKRLCAALLLAVPLTMSGCGGSDQAADSKKIVRVGGTVAVTSSMDPAKEWMGWYAVRYGVGETLFRLDDSMKPQPWLAEKAENVEPTVWHITL